MSNWLDKKTTRTKRLEKVLRKAFPNVAVYEYNSVSIRIRIIDERFQGKARSEREELVLPLLRKEPETVQADITVLLLLTADETGQSLMNMEFENPSPSLMH